MKLMLCCNLGLVLVLGATRAHGQKFNYQANVGLASTQRPGAWCAVLGDSILALGTPVILAWVPPPTTDDRPQLIHGTIKAHLPDSACPLELRLRGKAFYRVEAKSTSGLAPPYFVVAGPANLHIDGSSIVGDLDGDGVAESLRICTSREGLHYTVWSGKPLTGTRQFHRYYHLDYDVEPTCAEADYAN